MPKGLKKDYDFSGYGTRVGLRCSDGRTIKRDAFADQDGMTVPLVWQHMHDDPNNILGHAVLENREDGVYAYGFLNDTPNGERVKQLIRHGDVASLSIYANNLREKPTANGDRDVVHGKIRELSLVISGANPGAYIENVSFAHSDGMTVWDDDTEVYIRSGESVVAHSEGDDMEDDETIGDVLDTLDEKQSAVVNILIENALRGGNLSHSDDDDSDDETVGEVFNAMSEKQKTVVYAMLAKALETADEEEDDDDSDGKIKHSEGEFMKKNVFDQTLNGGSNPNRMLDRNEFKQVIGDAQRTGDKLSSAFMSHGFDSLSDAYMASEQGQNALAHAGEYGIENIGYLFPDYKATSAVPPFIQREMGWVSQVMSGVKKLPFSRIKTLHADITEDEARARGYITATKKVNEVFTLLKRTTDPQTIYKAQKLDRDNVVDITDFDVVAWLRSEMRMMLDEEIARAVLIGDGRQSSDPYKIQHDKIRPIAEDDDLYAIKVEVDDTDLQDVIDEIILARTDYKGSGYPTLFLAPKMVARMLIMRDTLGHRLYKNKEDLATQLQAKQIIEVPVFENHMVDEKPLLAILVNLSDYSLGADKGGSVNMFDDFDIDFNQYKYLIETRASGALTVPHSAIVVTAK